MAKRVILGMSGGVDSSVAAYLLQKEGYEVVGVSFRFIDEFDDTDAKKVAEKLGIEHFTADYREDFKKLVIDKFIDAYKMGITPNPCVECNRHVKIKFLYDEMIKHNCDYMTTGHYAKIKNDKLYRSADLNKDQTYFLCEVPYKMISKLLFPLEGINKDEVRKIADEIGLEVAHKKDSFDVCFINSNFREYMNNEIKINKGDIINVETKEKMGEHDGISHYTIGQRRGLDIGGTSGRTYVVGKDIDKNILYIAIGDDNEYLMSDECLLENVNLISYHHPTFATAKLRYRSKEIPVELTYLEDDKMLVKYGSGAIGVTPGQTCALYLGEECIGGGTIKEVRKNGEKLWYL